MKRGIGLTDHDAQPGHGEEGVVFKLIRRRPGGTGGLVGLQELFP